MATITIVRTDKSLPAEPTLAVVREFLFGLVQGLRSDDDRSWRRFWKRLVGMEAGEFVVLETIFPRSGVYHRRHMKLESSVFDAQERFTDFEQFRIWTKVGAGWVDWCAGPKGGVIPLPRSISYAKADQEQFTHYHELVIAFLRGPHAAKFLWRHMENPHEMMESILAGFNE